MTYQLVILEGPDGGGKSTVAQALSAKHRMRVIHHGPYKGEDGNSIGAHYVASMFAYDDDKPGGVILDRSWLSEPIYGTVFRGGEDRIGLGRQRAIERIALTLGAVVVLCLPPLAVCLNTWRERRGEEMLEHETQLTNVHTIYGGLGERTNMHVIKFDYTRDDVDMLWLKIKAAARPRPDGFPGGGSWDITNKPVLLVGERANDNKPLSDYDPDVPYVDVPFTGFGDSSAWLARKLALGGVGERSLYWVNALDAGGQERDITRIVRTLKPKGVITMGDVALQVCRRQGADVTANVPHPQFWKRFHHHEDYPLIGEIAKCLTKKRS